MPDFLNEAQELFPYTQALRRDFHRHPELGFHEVRTAGIVAQELNNLGLEVTTGLAETGVVGLMEGAHPGPVILLRFDMDALPVLEQTGAEYASQNAGVMHACGHDGHTAIGLTVARLLHRHRSQLHGTVKFVFQPAEEGLGGAEAMISAGVLAQPQPEYALALHLWNELPLGVIGISPAATMAAAEIFEVRVLGRGGHGAIPQLAVDPVVAAAQIISALQSIVARNVSPLEAGVISVTLLRAGEAFNVIPAEALLKGTIRSYDPGVRDQLLERFRQVVTGVATALGCQVEIDLQSLTPAIINDAQVAGRVQAAAHKTLPEHTVVDYRTMGSEDMAFMLQRVPGCYFFVGSANAKLGLNASHHHPRFDFDERVLPQAAAVMSAAAAEFLLAGPTP